METKTLANPLLFQGIATQPKASACERGENRLALDPLVVPGEDDLTHESGVGGLEPVEPPKDAAEPHDTAFAPDPGDLERLGPDRHHRPSYVRATSPSQRARRPSRRPISSCAPRLVEAVESPEEVRSAGSASGRLHALEEFRKQLAGRRKPPFLGVDQTGVRPEPGGSPAVLRVETAIGHRRGRVGRHNERVRMRAANAAVSASRVG